MKKSILAISAAVLLITAGCSSNSKNDLSLIKADIASAKEAAQKAYQAAQQANINAQDAKEIALKTDEKLNRVFKKSQLK